MFDNNNNNNMALISPISSLLKKWACGCPIASQWCKVRLRSICVRATKRLSYSFLLSTNWSIIFLTTLLRFCLGIKKCRQLLEEVLHLLALLPSQGIPPSNPPLQLHLQSHYLPLCLTWYFCPYPKPNLIRVVQMSRTFRHYVDMSCIFI